MATMMTERAKEETMRLELELVDDGAENQFSAFDWWASEIGERYAAALSMAKRRARGSARV